MKRASLAGAGALILLGLSTPSGLAQGQALKPYANDARVQQAAALLIDIASCPKTEALESLAERRLTDWLRHLGRGDNALTCSRLASGVECSKQDRASSADYWADLKRHYFEGRYSKNPRPAPDCAALATRVKGMKLLQSGWRPSDGFR
jgi:hypothetical protein